MHSLHLQLLDYAILIVYFVFVLGIGFLVRRRSASSSGEFLTGGRSVPAWVAGLAFLSANLGAQEVLGMGASGAKYGIMTSHFYWLGAIPAMAFVGVFMMPFYYGSKARSVPEYLKLRFDEKTRGLNAITFAVMTLLSSGVSLYALASLLEVLLGWNFYLSLGASAFIVLIYIYLGGLTAAIYNEVLQFFLIVLGFLPLALLGLKNVGGWSGLKVQLAKVATEHGYAAGAWVHDGRYLDDPAHNPMGVGFFSLVFGLGFVLSFGYWCTDFLVIQRALAADSLGAARRTPLIAAVPKMFFPFIVILPGMIAVALAYGTVHGGTTAAAHGFTLPPAPDGSPNYNMAVPALLGYYFPTGMLGLGLTALMASFMSGMAGNVTAFNTVFTVDIYEAYLAPGKSDRHYLVVGQLSTFFGIMASLAAALIASQFNNIMDLLQLVFGFVNAPLLATFLLGMFWRRSTGHGAFWGLIAGTTAAAALHGLTLPGHAQPGLKGAWLLHRSFHNYPSEMAQNIGVAIAAFFGCLIVTVVVSVLTRREKSDDDLRGLVYSLTPRTVEASARWWEKPEVLGVAVVVGMVILTALFW